MRIKTKYENLPVYLLEQLIRETIENPNKNANEKYDDNSDV